MARTYTKLLVHCVYGTKNRLPLIREPERVWNMTREIARNLKIDITAIGAERRLGFSRGRGRGPTSQFGSRDCGAVFSSRRGAPIRF